jgi:DNA repair exonuclease SbcCD nuclease subunit
MKQRVFYLGDIHGSFNIINQYVKLYGIKDAHIIQVGDFGVGFKTVEKETRMLEMFHDILVKNNVHVWAIRGNHDYKPHFDNDPFGFTNIHLIPDYTVLELGEKRILCIGGAISVDRNWRYTKNQRMGIYENQTLGVESWWPDELFILDRDKLGEFRDIDIVVTHTAPHYCEPDNTFGFGPFVDGIVRETGDNELKTDLIVERNQVTDAFTILKMNNNITHHYYGHFHKTDVMNYDGIKHRLLNVNELWEERD